MLLFSFVVRCFEVSDCVRDFRFLAPQLKCSEAKTRRETVRLLIENWKKKKMPVKKQGSWPVSPHPLPPLASSSLVCAFDSHFPNKNTHTHRVYRFDFNALQRQVNLRKHWFSSLLASSAVRAEERREGKFEIIAFRPSQIRLEMSAHSLGFRSWTAFILSYRIFPLHSIHLPMNSVFIENANFIYKPVSNGRAPISQPRV